MLSVDLDPQANASSGLGDAPADAGQNSLRRADRQRKSGFRMHRENAGGDARCCCPAISGWPARRSELVAARQDREYILREALKPLRAQVRLHLHRLSALAGAADAQRAVRGRSRASFPIQCEYYALEGVGQLMNTVQRVQRGLNPHLDVEGVVLTMMDGRTNLGIQVAQEVKKHFRPEGLRRDHSAQRAPERGAEPRPAHSPLRRAQRRARRPYRNCWPKSFIEQKARGKPMTSESEDWAAAWTR